MRSPNPLRLAAICLFLLPAVACGGLERPPEPETGTEVALDDAENERLGLSASAAADRALRSGEPLILRIEPDDRLLEFIRELGAGKSDRRFLRLTLEGLETPLTQAAVRVFVNTPQATEATSIEEPGYLADVGFHPTADFYGVENASSFLLDLGSTLAELPPERRLVDGRFVDITLMALPAKGVAGPENAPVLEIPLQGVKLTAHTVPGRSRRQP